MSAKRPMLMQPDEDDHPRLRELWEATRSPRVVWRLHYGLPPNDPRVLEIGEQEVYDDLLLLAYTRLRAEMERNPAMSQGVGKRADAWREAQERAEAGEDEVHNAHVARLQRLLYGKPPSKPPSPTPAPRQGTRWGQPWSRDA